MIAMHHTAGEGAKPETTRPHRAAAADHQIMVGAGARIEIDPSHPHAGKTFMPFAHVLTLHA